MIVLPPEILTQPGFTRAGTATYYDQDGIRRTAAAGVLRPLYVAGALRGVLIESAATNLLVQSAAVDSNTGWTKGSAITRVGTTTGPAGDAVATVYSSTGGVTIGVTQGAKTLAAGTTYTVSVCAKLISGPIPASGSLMAIDYDSNGVASTLERTTRGWAGLDATWREFSIAFTNVAALATGVASFLVDLPAGTQIALADAQLEVGGVRTSFIPTAAAAVARAADVLTGSGRDVLYSNAVEAAPEWITGTNYASGAVCIRASTRRRYTALVAITGSAIAPETDVARWKDIGAVNHLAMFDQGRNLQTVGPVGSKLRVAIYCSGRINSLFLARLEASYGTVVMYVGGVEVYRKDLTLTRRKTRSWSTYLYGTFDQLSSVLLTDLPMLAGATIVLELDNGAYAAKCASMVISQSVSLGDTQWGGSSDPLVFSVVNRDAYGNAELVPRRMAPATSQVLKIPAAQIPTAMALRDRLNARFAVWAGMNDNTESPWSEMFLICGIYTRFKIDAQDAKEGSVDLDLQEF